MCICLLMDILVLFNDGLIALLLAQYPIPPWAAFYVESQGVGPCPPLKTLDTITYGTHHETKIYVKNYQDNFSK